MQADMIDQAQTLLQQHRYLEAYELLENADLGAAEKRSWLASIPKRAEDALLGSLVLRFDTHPFYLLEPVVRFWKVFPLWMAGATFFTLIVLLWNDDLRFLPVTASVTVYFISHYLSRMQIARFEQKNAEKLAQSNREMIIVYQLLLDERYREAREILEGGVIMPSVAYAWLTWLNRVYREERERGGIKTPEIAPPYERDKTLHTSLYVGATLGIAGALILSRAGVPYILFPVVLFGSILAAWVSVWAVRIAKMPYGYERHDRLIWLSAWVLGLIVFGLTMLAVSGVFIFFFTQELMRENEAIFGPLAMVTMIPVAMYAAYVTINFIKQTFGYEGSRRKAK